MKVRCFKTPNTSCTDPLATFQEDEKDNHNNFNTPKLGGAFRTNLA